ncbi:hypothetical protein Mal52_30740 [Symmachiella dynata]|uniref:Transcriptional repressor NrdR-like N-terminal domain-containing protein n=1 Tax=Symmachiella dynata TaxID=2527995 RepID=A0A517ZQ25_9PLAN|nr:hypothetical protein Mal52_30740 [Symmachiella dynata]
MDNGNNDNAPRGLTCPRCGRGHFFTTNSEPLPNGRIRRRKRCPSCGRIIVAYEVEIESFSAA